MEWKVIEFTFSQPLTEEQENSFILIFQDLRDKIIRAADMSAGAANNPLSKAMEKITNTNTLDFLRIQLKALRDNIGEYMRLEKAGTRAYRFKVLYQNLQIVAPVMKVDFWDRMQSMIKKNRRKFASELKIKESDITISFSSVEDKDNYFEIGENSKGE